jgi:hypothetical protein
MIRGDEYWSISGSGFNIFQTVNLHEVVSSDMNPTGPENTLAPRPKAFPVSLIHAMDKTKGESLEPIQDRKLVGSRLQKSKF